MLSAVHGMTMVRNIWKLKLMTLISLFYIITYYDKLEKEKFYTSEQSCHEEDSTLDTNEESTTENVVVRNGVEQVSKLVK